jgi:hypothetical protein
MAREWSFITNPFLNATAGSYPNARKISIFHDTALANGASDPFLGPIYTAYHPLHTAFMTAYNAWVSQGHVQIGETLSLSQLIVLLKGTKINLWDVGIQNVYNKKTSQYVTLLPHKRIPFQHGTQDELIEAVQSLSTNLTGITALASVKTDVDNFLNQLNTANNTQKSGKQSKATHSVLLENERIAICNAQYANLGSMINHFSATPENIADYFDVATIRAGAQVHFTGHLKPLHIHNICKHTFGVNDEITIKNDSAIALHVYLASAKNLPAPTGAHSIAANTKETVKAGQLGNVLDTFLLISNPDAHVTAHWELTID